MNGHDEPIERMKAHGILIDGEGVIDGGMTKILLQIFSKTVIGLSSLNSFKEKAMRASAKEISGTF